MRGYDEACIVINSDNLQMGQSYLQKETRKNVLHR